MDDLPTFPFISEEILFDEGPVPTPENIIILYYPNASGNFLARVLSCSNNLYGEDYADFIKNNYSTLENKNKIWEKSYEGSYHPLFSTVHPRFYNFDEFLKFPKIVHINYTLSDQETSLIKFRRKFTKTSATCPYLADLQIRYEIELMKFFKNINKEIYSFPFSAFLNAKIFAQEVNKLLLHLDLEIIKENIIVDLYNFWWKLNIRLYKNTTVNL